MMNTKKAIDADTLRDWLETGKPVTVLDVRPEAERKEWYIPGSIYAENVYENIKNGDPDSLEQVHLDKAIPVVTVCARGKTSLIASELLQKMGYEAYNLAGGMKSWSTSWNVATVSFIDFEIIQFRRTGKGCLSYLIISDGEAMVVDASLPVEVYRKVIDERKLTLRYATDTHIHADHLSRSGKLAEAYGIALSMPANDKLEYPFDPVYDNDSLTLGKIQVKATHTPGHTMESTCYLVGGRVLLTGDTLFTDGVGRPDLKADQNEATRKARLLHQSLRKLMEMDRSLIVMPGHISRPVPFDQKAIQSLLDEVVARTALLKLEESEFVRSILSRIPATPENYLTLVARNIAGDFLDNNVIDLEDGANRCAIS